jgi:hypothetical protein
LPDGALTATFAQRIELLVAVGWLPALLAVATLLSPGLRLAVARPSVPLRSATAGRGLAWRN